MLQKAPSEQERRITKIYRIEDLMKYTIDSIPKIKEAEKLIQYLFRENRRLKKKIRNMKWR